MRISMTLGLVIFFLGLSALVSSVLCALRPGDETSSTRTDELTADVKSKTEERDRLKTDNDRLDAKIAELNSKLSPPSANDRATAKQSDAGATDLARFLSSVVTVALNGENHGTGLVFKASDNSILVVTALSTKAQRQPISLEFHFDPKSRDKGNIVNCGATVVYSDADSGFCILRPDQANLISRYSPFSGDQIKPAQKGEHVFALISHRFADGNISAEIIDGIVSSVERKKGGHTELQVAIGAGDSVRGAPIISKDANWVGVMLQSDEDIEQTHFALKTESFIGAILSAKGSLPVVAQNNVQSGPVIVQQNGRTIIQYGRAQPIVVPQMPQRVDTSAARTHASPYRVNETIAANADILLAGPGNLVVVWDNNAQRLGAYKPQNPTAAWETTPQTRSEALPLCNQPKVLLRSMTDYSVTEINLADGHAAKTFAPGMNQVTRTRLYTLPGGKLLATSPPSIIDPQGKQKRFIGEGQVIGIVDDNVFELQPGCFVSYSIGTKLEQYRKRDDLENGMKNRTREEMLRLNDEINKLDTAISTDKKKIQANGLATAGFDPGYQIANKNQFVVGHEIWELLSDSARRIGTLPSVRHSAEQDPWFQAYLLMQGQHGVVAVSASGKYAATQTHLYELSSLKMIAELPLPVCKCVITSDDSTLAAYDEAQRCVYFFSIDELIRMGKR